MTNLDESLLALARAGWRLSERTAMADTTTRAAVIAPVGRFDLPNIIGQWPDGYGWDRVELTLALLTEAQTAEVLALVASWAKSPAEAGEPPC
ncbi:hypothetical protein AB0I61_17165 [Polymorphospora rubra]|uniref:hypothetical protein n=1 Tax=Polymorphospora rubra TaxID=338584 RepID=UPI0033C1C45F